MASSTRRSTTLGRSATTVLVERSLDLRRIDEVEDTAQPERGVEELHASALELQEHLLDVGEPERKSRARSSR
jgi:hypothetical protein